MKSYLNIAAGKIEPLFYQEDNSYDKFLVQLDTMYYNTHEPDFIERTHDMFIKSPEKCHRDICYTNRDAFEFLGIYKQQFDFVSCYRFLEHVKKTDVQGFLYLLSTALKIGGTLDIIVPNYETLADMILNENLSKDVSHVDWERHDTLLTYELLNEPSMPHASIWTPNRIKYFFELEERFEIKVLNPNFLFDGRDIYIRAIIKRVK